jgi:hypothetical protein
MNRLRRRIEYGRFGVVAALRLIKKRQNFTIIQYSLVIIHSTKSIPWEKA